MLTFEALAMAFFAMLGAAAPFAHVSRVRRGRAALVATGLVVGVLTGVQTLAPTVRVWFGLVFLVMGYWIPALLVPTRTSGAFEAWLIRTDQRWRRYVIATPGLAAHTLELSYLLCYVLVPLAFTVMWTYGNLAQIDRFWTAVLLSGFGCYGSLPWLISRPPRMLDTTEPTGIRRLNVFVLGRVSHGLNSFPSGHVAVSVAAALAVLSVSRPAGLAMIVLAAGTAAGAVAGRYHYAVDVVLGIAVGMAASVLV